MAAQLPGPSPEWQAIPNSSQFLDVGASTGLTIPAIPGRPQPGAKLVGILYAQGVAAYLRTDGQAVTAAITGGIKMEPDSFVVIYGDAALRQVRIVRSAGGGSVAVSYYWFRDAQSGG